MLIHILLSLFISPVQAAENTSTVTIPIKEYLDLKKISEKKSVTTLEEVQLTGEFGKNLQVAFFGSSQGEAEFLPILKDNGIGLSNCQGAAALRVENGSLELLPQSSKFKLSCQANIKNWDQVQLVFLNALFVKSEVKGAEVQTVGGTIGERRISLIKNVPNRVITELPVTDEEPSAIGRYQITVYPEETKFRYYLTFNNPNRSLKNFKLNFPNQEVVQKMDTTIVYEEKDKTFNLKLPTGESQLVVTGRLPQPAFSSLVKSAVEYVLIENSPVLTLQLKEPAQRISVSDSRMAAKFLGARAYLLTKGDKISWTSEKLEVFSALTYTVRSANYHYLWKEEGSNLVEAQFNIDNQGAAEIPLSLPGKPLYLEINGVPQVLAKNLDQQLLLRLPSGGSQNVTVQYEIEEKNKRGLASLSDDLARPGSVISRADLTLSMPKKKQLLFAESFHDKKYFYSWSNLIFALLGFLMAYKFFQHVSLSQRSSMLSAGAIGFLIFMKGLFWPFFWILLAALVLHNREKIKTPATWQSWLKLTAGLALLIFVLPYVIRMFDPVSRNTMLSDMAGANDFATDSAYSVPAAAPVASNSFGGGGAAYEKKAALAKVAESAPMEAQMDEAYEEEERLAVSKPEMSLGTESYQGIPAKILLPHDGRQVYFRSELLDLNSPMKITAVAVSSFFYEFFYFAMILILGFVLWKKRDELAQYLKVTKYFRVQG